MIRRHTLLAVALSVVFAPASALAVDAVLGEMVVTATGQETTDLELPLTVSTSSTDDALVVNPTWIGELLNREAGVMASQLRGPVDVISAAGALRQCSALPARWVPLHRRSVSITPRLYIRAHSPRRAGSKSQGPGTAIYGTDAFSGVINVKSRAAHGSHRIRNPRAGWPIWAGRSCCRA